MEIYNRVNVSCRELWLAFSSVSRFAFISFPRAQHLVKKKKKYVECDTSSFRWLSARGVRRKLESFEGNNYFNVQQNNLQKMERFEKRKFENRNIRWLAQWNEEIEICYAVFKVSKFFLDACREIEK